jgi:predicted Zn-dependent protease
MTTAPQTQQSETLESVEAAFEAGMERYRAGEDPATLIPLFKEICEQVPQNATSWSCLAWLYLLVDKPSAAFKAAQKAVKADVNHPQAQINLALAMLAAKRSGVRPHVELARQIMALDREIHQSVLENLEDGLSRKPDWNDLKRIKVWLLE